MRPGRANEVLFSWLVSLYIVEIEVLNGAVRERRHAKGFDRFLGHDFSADKDPHPIGKLFRFRQKVRGENNRLPSRLLFQNEIPKSFHTLGIEAGGRLIQQ